MSSPSKTVIPQWRNAVAMHVENPVGQHNCQEIISRRPHCGYPLQISSYPWRSVGIIIQIDWTSVGGQQDRTQVLKLIVL